MTTVLNQWRPAVIGAVLALALVAGVFAMQNARHRWPFPLNPTAVMSAQEGSEHTGMSMPQSAETPTNAHAGHGAPSGDGGLPLGYAAITINPAHLGAIELATAVVETRDFTKNLHTVGIVTIDETRSAHVHSKVRGWIDGIYVNFVGRRIRAGEALCSIYSQEVYSAEIEFLSILDRAVFRPSEPASASSSASATDPLLDAARRRLSLWDVPRAEIARLESSREARRTFPLLAPRGGVVVSKEAIQGMYVDPSVELYTIADLSQLWVLADIYEADVPFVHIGDHAHLTIEGQNPALDATVSFISPTIDEATRTLKVRFHLDNRAGRMRPGSFVSVDMDLAMGRSLAIPESAVIRTGTRSIVFVAHGNHLQPREITLGPIVGEIYRVQAGLVAGEHVAIGAQFLLDSESRLRATSTPGGAHVH